MIFKRIKKLEEDINYLAEIVKGLSNQNRRLYKRIFELESNAPLIGDTVMYKGKEHKVTSRELVNNNSVRLYNSDESVLDSLANHVNRSNYWAWYFYICDFKLDKPIPFPVERNEIKAIE